MTLENINNFKDLTDDQKTIALKKLIVGDIITIESGDVKYLRNQNNYNIIYCNKNKIKYVIGGNK